MAATSHKALPQGGMTVFLGRTQENAVMRKMQDAVALTERRSRSWEIMTTVNPFPVQHIDGLVHFPGHHGVQPRHGSSSSSMVRVARRKPGPAVHAAAARRTVPRSCSFCRPPPCPSAQGYGRSSPRWALVGKRLQPPAAGGNHLPHRGGQILLGLGALRQIADLRIAETGFS